MADSNYKVEIPALSKQFPSDFDLSPQEMVDFNNEHARKFHEGDFAGIMEHSIIDDAVWEFYPNRIRVTGKEALLRYHEMNYNIVIAQVREGWNSLEFYSELSSNNTISHEMSCDFTRKDGTSFRGYFIAVIPFANGKMAGERIYMDKEMGEWFEESLDPDFFKLPGVERF